MASATDEVFGLFPTPVLRAAGVLSPRLVDGLLGHFARLAQGRNAASGQLAHTALLGPGDSPLLIEAAAAITPKIADLGALMFGERLGWSIKEMWVNVLEAGGHQAMHNHANSLVSGVVYLTPMPAGSQTTFFKPQGGTDFVLKHEHAGVSPTPFNGDRWVGPVPAPGDVLLFPSYLLHAVPVHQGAQRVTMAFNAIPGGLDAWGYAIKFGA